MPYPSQRDYRVASCIENLFTAHTKSGADLTVLPMQKNDFEIQSSRYFVNRHSSKLPFHVGKYGSICTSSFPGQQWGDSTLAMLGK